MLRFVSVVNCLRCPYVSVRGVEVFCVHPCSPVGLVGVESDFGLGECVDDRCPLVSKEEIVKLLRCGLF